MKRFQSLPLLTLLLLAPPVLAQRVEITPLVGYRVGGSLSFADGDAKTVIDVDDAASFGVQLAVKLSDEGELELLYARQDTSLRTSGLFTGKPVFDLSLETWQAGGNYLIGEPKARVRPYVGAGLGVTRLLPKPADLQNETRFSASVAGGVRVSLGSHFGLRAEARGFFTVVDGDSKAICRPGEGCDLRTKGSDISQGEVRAGLSLRF